MNDNPFLNTAAEYEKNYHTQDKNQQDQERYWQILFIGHGESISD